MPTPVFNTSTYPKLQRKYKDIPNLAWILDNINTEFAHIFNLEALEECVGTNEETSPYFALFDECIQKVRTSGQNYYDTAEITNILAPWLFKKINDPFWSRQAFMVFDREMPSKRQMGFVEKFFNGALIPDLSNKEALEQYAFHTLDMLRSAACYKPAIVVELQHLSYLNLPSVTNPMFIRCRPKNKNGLPQWLTLYTNKKTHQMCVYSESPVDESDWNLLNTFLESKEINPNTITREGMKAGLSVSSGMRAVTKWNDQVGGAGFSLEADYPSLLVEWAWRTEVVSPYGISEKYQKKQANGYAESLSFGWTHFRNTMTQRRSDGSFVLMDVCTPAANPAYNDHLQMRSYNLGLDWLLADKQIKLLTIDDKKGTVHLKVPETLIINGTDVHYQGKSFSSIFGQYQPEIGTSYAAKAVIGFGGMVLTRRPDGSPSSGSAFSNTLEEATATGMALHVFRACAKQKTLSMEIPTKYRFNPDEISLIYMLMEQNPFVCELKVDNNHPDLIQLRDRLQHVFARNRWLNMSGYVPPLLDDFWDAAAHYWVGHLKINSQTLMDEKDSEQIEFRRCVNEMGLHGLKAALSYLQREEPNLNIDFYKLLQNKDAPPAFYAACAPADMKEYTNLLLQHLQGGRYFPFGQFHFRFVPGANGDILDLLGQLNTLRSFQRITLQDCLVDIPAFSGFLDAILERLKTDPSWSCPILMPELDVEHAFKNKEVLDLRKKYLNINNILMDRVRVKNSKELANIAFTEAVDLGAPVEEDAPAAPVAGGQPLPDQSKLKEEFNKALTAAGVVNFPINRAGGLALQMQQQQQIKQERSRCLDHETEKGTAYQDILPAHLVTYDNIDDILGDYFTQFQKDHT
ncbi:MAG: hypothetical protein Q8R79_06605, partial [Legionellaceae bacterium]|nr:hypothetical protein [Legionellaceae bacterium]